MNEMLEERITKAFGRRPRNMEKVIELYNIMINNAEITLDECRLYIEITDAAFYRIKRDLKNSGILQEFGTVKDLHIPMAVRIGQLPPVKYGVTHLAAHLNRFKDEEVVPPYGKTKKQILTQLRQFLLEDAEIGNDIVWGIQERLAYLALLSGDISQFKNMLGAINPPETLPLEKSNA